MDTFNQEDEIRPGSLAEVVELMKRIVACEGGVFSADYAEWFAKSDRFLVAIFQGAVVDTSLGRLEVLGTPLSNKPRSKVDWFDRAACDRRLNLLAFGNFSYVHTASQLA
jgi:hypothetical protein